MMSVQGNNEMSLFDRRLSASILAIVMATAGVGAATAETTGHDVGPAPAAAPAAAAVVAAASAGPTFSISVPTIKSENSSMSDDALKAVIGGDIAGHATELATLSATSIRAPHVLVSFTMQKPNAAGAITIVYDYKDVDIEGVKAGIAASISVGGVDAKSAGGADPKANFDFQFGKIVTTGVDIGATLALYGLVPASSDQTMKPLYTGSTFAGGSLTSPSANCTFGPATLGAFSARPFKVSFADLISLLSDPALKANTLPPEDITKLALFYADLLSAVKSEPSTLTGIDCSGTDDKGAPIAFKMGPITIGGFGNDRYPAVTLQNMSIAASNGSMSLDSATMKGIDLSGPIGVVENAGVPLTEAWFTANARKLIPAFDGFAFSGLKLDVPDDQNAGERIKATMTDFDLSLSNYLGGIPMSISSVAHHFAIAVPAAVGGKSDDYDELRQLGISTLDLGYDVMLHRDAPTNTLVIDKVGVDGAGLGSVAVSGVIGNVVDTFFSGDAEAAEAAAMALTLKSVKLDVVDAGLGDLIFTMVGKQQGMTLAQARSSMSSTAQGLVLVTLSGSPAAKTLGDAVGKFVAGAKALSIAVTAKDPSGLSVVDYAAAQSNPTALLGKVNIDATAQ
jgi:hypothetical protein